MKKRLSIITLALVLALSTVFVMAVPASAGTVNSVTILSPLATAPTTAMTGGTVEVTATLDVDSADYYTLSILVVDDSTAWSPPNPPTWTAIGGYSDLIYLPEGTTTVTRMATLYAGLTADSYDVVVSLDSEVDTAVNAVAVWDDLNGGATVPTILAGKGVILVNALLDTFVDPSTIGGSGGFIVTGSADGSMTGDGSAWFTTLGSITANLTTPVGDLATDGVDIASGVVGGVKASVVTTVPPVVNGALKVVNEIVSLFSTSLPVTN
jgi:hypothetical protein